MPSLTSAGKTMVIRIGIILGLVALFFVGRYAKQKGVGREWFASTKVDKITNLGSGQALSMTGSASTKLPLPSKTPASLTGATNVRVEWWAWQTQNGCQLANGGAQTTDGSLIAKANINMTITRQDENPTLQGDLYALAKQMRDEKTTEPDKGVMFVGIMGDGAAPFIYELNQKLKDLGPDYHAEIVGSCGYSRGEDKLMGPKKWKDNPQSMKGAVIAGVIRDGDWNIGVHFAGDNNLKVNPDEKSYDPTAINFMNVASYTDAADKYNTGAKFGPVPIVIDGKPTGRDTTVDVEGVVTWTPADVTIADHRGGLVSVVSTKEYAFQMPHVIIGIRKWNQTHREAVENMLAAFAEAGDQMLTYPDAADRAFEIANDIYHEKGWTAADWKKYFYGVEKRDATGTVVSLGGSKVNNMADNLLLFGLAEGTSPATSRFHASFTTFCSIASKMYPKLIPTCPKDDEVLDLSYLKVASTKVGSGAGKAEVVKYATTAMTNVVGDANININFVTGSAKLTPAGEAQLRVLSARLTTNALRVVVHGHTDNTGSDDANMKLAEDRAFAVKSWLEQNDAANFPEGRIKIQAHGSRDPLVPNTTETGRAKNRRVQIVIGQ
jgi:OOP family OmpA-OmpF porin